MRKDIEQEDPRDSTHITKDSLERTSSYGASRWKYSLKPRNSCRWSIELRYDLVLLVEPTMFVGLIKTTMLICLAAIVAWLRTVCRNFHLVESARGLAWVSCSNVTERLLEKAETVFGFSFFS